MAKTYRNQQRETATTIKDANGVLLIKPKQSDKWWAEYFEDSLNAPGITSSTDGLPKELSLTNNDSEEDITTDEVQNAIKKMANKKSPWVDYLPAEIYKHGGRDLMKWITSIFNAAWTTGQTPDDWAKAIICPGHKKGDREECGNYRGMSLLPHIAKIYLRILENQLRHFVEAKLGQWEQGYRPNRCTSDLIFALKIILEKSWEYNTSTNLAFLDLEKAFDRIPGTSYGVFSGTLNIRFHINLDGLFKGCIDIARVLSDLSMKRFGSISDQEYGKEVFSLRFCSSSWWTKLWSVLMSNRVMQRTC